MIVLGDAVDRALTPGTSLRRSAGAAAWGLAGTSMAVAVLEAVVLDVSIVTPADLVADVARLQVPWVAAQVLLVLGQVLLLVVVVGLGEVLGRGPAVSLGRSLLGAAAGLFVLSGVFHGVFGWHVAALDVLAGPERAGAVHLAEIVHAFGDTTYYLGVAATAGAMLALAPALRRCPSLGRGLAALGVWAAVAELVEFGYFLLPGLAWVAPVGVLLQAAWYARAGHLLRTGGPDDAVVPAGFSGSGPTC